MFYTRALLSIFVSTFVSTIPVIAYAQNNEEFKLPNTPSLNLQIQIPKKKPILNCCGEDTQTCCPIIRKPFGLRTTNDLDGNLIGPNGQTLYTPKSPYLLIEPDGAVKLHKFTRIPEGGLKFDRVIGLGKVKPKN